MSGTATKDYTQKGIMASNLLDPHPDYITYHNSADGKYISYPQTTLGTIQTLCDKLGWIVFPLHYLDIQPTLRSYIQKDIFYAYNIFCAISTFRSCTPSKNLFVAAPLDTLDLELVATEAAKAQEQTNYFDLLLNQQMFFPPSEEDNKSHLAWCQTLLVKYGKNIIELKHLKHESLPASAFPNPVDPIVFSVNRFGYYPGGFADMEPEATCAVGCCFGPELPNYMITDTKTLGINTHTNNFSSITFPYLHKHTPAKSNPYNNVTRPFPTFTEAQDFLNYFDSAWKTGDIRTCLELLKVIAILNTYYNNCESVPFQERDPDGKKREQLLEQNYGPMLGYFFSHFRQNYGTLADFFCQIY